MKKILQLLCFFQITGFHSNAQLELLTPSSVYFKDRSRSIGEVKYLSKKKVIQLNTGVKNVEIPILEIDSIITDYNETFVIRKWENQYNLYEKIVKGKASLLYKKGENQYYVQRNDSITLLSQKLLKGTLIVLFPDFLLSKKLSKERNATVRYNDKFLSNYVHSYNKEVYPGAKSQIFEASSSKQNWYISPYLGYQLTQTKIKSDNQNTTSSLYASPVFGLSFSYKRPFKKLYLEMDLYKNSFSIIKEKIDETVNLTKGASPGSFVILSFKPTITSFKSENIFLDTKIIYDFRRRTIQKTIPYISVGPSVGFPLKSEVIFGTIYYDFSNEKEFRLYSQSTKFTSYYHFGGNASVGIKHTFTTKLQLKIGVKVQSTFIKVVPRNAVSLSQNPVNITGSPSPVPYIISPYTFVTTNRSVLGDFGLYFKF